MIDKLLNIKLCKNISLLEYKLSLKSLQEISANHWWSTKILREDAFCFFVSVQSSGMTFLWMSERNYVSLMNQNYSSGSLINVKVSCARMTPAKHSWHNHTLIIRGHSFPGSLTRVFKPPLLGASRSIRCCESRVYHRENDRGGELSFRARSNDTHYQPGWLASPGL